MEVQHLIRVLSSPQAVAKDFAAYCKRNQVITRGLCKIGYVNRKPPAEARPQSGAGYLPSGSADFRLRGLIANKDIKKDDNVVMLAERACVHPGRALRCAPFLRLLPPDVQEKQFMNPRLLMNDRLAPGALIRYHQLLMALYMTYITMAHRLRPDWASAKLPGSDVIQYLDFLPRVEADFRALTLHLSRWLDTSAVVRECEPPLAKEFEVTQAEVRAVLLYSLCMIFSRVVPVDHKDLLRAAFRQTPQEEWVGKPQAREEGPHPPAALNPSDDLTSEFVSEPISFLCPIIDMCNHSTTENVAVMVPSSASRGESQSSGAGPVICLRSLRDIHQGEELTMSYSHTLEELKVVWGMNSVLE